MAKGDDFILRAERNGKPRSYCYIRKSMSRYHKARVESDKKLALKYLEDAMQFIKIADDSLSDNDSYYAKNKNTIIEYKNVKIPKQIYFTRNRKI